MSAVLSLSTDDKSDENNFIRPADTLSESDSVTSENQVQISESEARKEDQEEDIRLNKTYILLLVCLM